MGPESEDVRVASRKAQDIDFEGLAEALEPLGYAKRLELLGYLTQPHYLEEIASYLGMSRQAARKHVDRLLEIGAITKQQGERETGPVVEYVVVPQTLFALSEDFAKLGTLPSEEAELTRTQVTSPSDPEQAGEGAGPALVLVHGLQRGRTHSLARPPGPWTIGRDEERDISLLYDPFVSHHHAEIALEDGEHVLVDAFSTNGTFLNWERLDRGGKRPLKSGDVVGVGKSLFVYRR